MRHFRPVPLLAALVVAGCGESPTAPVPIEEPPVAVTPQVRQAAELTSDVADWLLPGMANRTVAEQLRSQLVTLQQHLLAGRAAQARQTIAAIRQILGTLRATAGVDPDDLLVADILELTLFSIEDAL